MQKESSQYLFILHRRRTMLLLSLCVLLLMMSIWQSSSILMPPTAVPFAQKMEHIRKRFSSGLGEIIPNFILADKINKRSKRDKHSISFTEFQFANNAAEDFWKVARLIFTLSVSQEFFLYGYLVSPIFSSSPKAWSSW